MAALLRLFFLITIFSTTSSASTCIDEIGKKLLTQIWDLEEARYVIFHQYPNSRDSDHFTVIETKNYWCETDGLTSKGYDNLASLKSIYKCGYSATANERERGGYGCTISSEQFWDSTVDICQLRCEKL